MPQKIAANFPRSTLTRAALMALAWLWLYHDVLRRLLNDWRVDENYSHGFLIPLIGAYAIWQQRQTLRATPLTPRTGAGLLTLLGALALLWAGVLGGELYATRLSLLLSLIGLTLYFGGMVWLRRLAFPLGLLFFALPLPALIFNPAAFSLQLLSSEYATRALQLCGVPALREGNVIELAQLKLQVVEACSGIRSLMSLAALAVVYAYFTERQWWRRVLLVVAVVPIAVLTNAARVAGTGLLAHYRGPRVAEGFLHDFSGWLVFATAVLLLLGLAQMLNLLTKLSAPLSQEGAK